MNFSKITFYLISKNLFYKKTSFYIDCFAGKGSLDDDNPGSPIIALNVIDAASENDKSH